MTVSGLAELVARHPAGLDLKVGDAGCQLSGGQRQLVAVCRGILGDPPVVVMDEPTASLDSASEQGFVRRMDEYLKGKTLVLITHKVPLLKLVDRLIILDDGKVVHSGMMADLVDDTSLQSKYLGISGITD